MCGRNHLRARQACVRAERIKGKFQQLRHKQKQAPAASVKLARGEREASCIGHGLDSGARTLRTFIVAPSRQRRKTLDLEHLAHGGSTQ